MHNEEAVLRKEDKALLCLWNDIPNAPLPMLLGRAEPCLVPQFAGLQSAAGLRSSLRKHPRHLNIPPGAGKAAAALKLQPSSYWHEEENRARRGKGRGREGGGGKRGEWGSMELVESARFYFYFTHLVSSFFFNFLFIFIFFSSRNHKSHCK